MNNLINRVLRAALLDREFYKEVEHDPTLNQEALLVVIIVSVFSGISAFISSLMIQQFGAAVLGLITSSVLGVASYYLWAYVTHYLGTKMFQGEAESGELLRVLGYASAPRLLSLFSFIPCVGPLLGLAGGIWALVAGFIGAQEALDLDTTETLVTVVVGWFAILIIGGLVTSLLGIGAAGLGSTLSLFGR